MVNVRKVTSSTTPSRHLCARPRPNHLSAPILTFRDNGGRKRIVDAVCPLVPFPPRCRVRARARTRAGCDVGIDESEQASGADLGRAIFHAGTGPLRTARTASAVGRSAHQPRTGAGAGLDGRADGDAQCHQHADRKTGDKTLGEMGTPSPNW